MYKVKDFNFSVKDLESLVKELNQIKERVDVVFLEDGKYIITQSGEDFEGQLFSIGFAGIGNLDYDRKGVFEDNLDDFIKNPEEYYEWSADYKDDLIIDLAEKIDEMYLKEIIDEEIRDNIEKYL